MSLLASWSDIPVGTIVTLRRGALTGERTEFTKAWTMSGPYRSSTGVACIRVEVGGVVVSYPLARVSLGWNEPRPAAIAAIPLATVLDPAPEQWTAIGAVSSLVTGLCLVYLVGAGLVAILDWVAR